MSVLAGLTAAAPGVLIELSAVRTESFRGRGGGVLALAEAEEEVSGGFIRSPLSHLPPKRPLPRSLDDSTDGLVVSESGLGVFR
jgi:hypothetical protein